MTSEDNIVIAGTIYRPGDRVQFDTGPWDKPDAPQWNGVVVRGSGGYPWIVLTDNGEISPLSRDWVVIVKSNMVAMDRPALEW